MLKSGYQRVALGLVAIAVLAGVYIFQGLGWLGDGADPYKEFIINRLIRFLANDIACMALIVAVFNTREALRVAFFVFLVELLFLLPAYFAIKLTMEGPSEISSPWLSQWHRMIVNPLLMLMLLVGLWLQKGRRIS